MKAVILDQDTFGQEKIGNKKLNWSKLLLDSIDWQCYGHTAPEQLIARTKDADIILVNKVVLDADTLHQAKHLKYIGVLATGTNNIDHQVAKELGIQVTNVAAYGTASVVQHTFMLMLNLVSSFPAYQAQIQNNEWQKASTFCLLDHPMHELANKHLVIVGFGELGKAVAEIAKAFGMKVSVAARPGNISQPNRQSLDELLPDADFVSLHCLLSKDTKNLINKQTLSKMKPSAFLINTARGQLVDEPALLHALNHNQIAGAGLDVLSQEPPPKNHPLLQYQGNNLIITPHNAWATIEARQRLINIAADKLQRFLLQR